ncbi:MAG TPA: glycosyltransferase family 2 protein [Ferruginibacter sp.]|nr:glycosyltransferase family 2 protein [Ferruginibacter sp.]HRO05248.1 glycosyltransferase family 2 protein [Ferruginibacter sp.]HRO96010.1 glycosyltransferase family 2 protein [Ferruginibacter sp.]HRP48656.1 glycosyltransferase family 2 protein [Ferruginibacter sp.]
MRVTIITPTYNSEQYLKDCIESVLSQDYKDIEYIVVDGLSTDSTKNIIFQYQDKIAAWKSEKDRGMYDAINKGMQMATGDIIGILNSDDVLASTDVISAIVQTFKQHPVDTIYGDLQYVDPGDINKIYRTWKGKPFKRSRFKYGWMPAHPTFYIKRELVSRYGGYENHYYSAADYEFMSRYLYVNNVSSMYLPKLLVKMRRGGQSNSSILQRLRANRRDYLAMKKNKIPFPFIVSILKPLIKIPQYYRKNERQ